MSIESFDKARADLLSKLEREVKTLKGQLFRSTIATIFVGIALIIHVITSL